MKSEEIVALFDGRGRIELLLGTLENLFTRNVEGIAHALGYRLLSTEVIGRTRIRYCFERDDAPLARRRAELTIARLRAGGPVLPACEPPPPPPPSPPPPLPPESWPPLPPSR
ncbi:hypothetical protein [Streptomyces colonosanans]|uniref:Uncharacterized protein n=1 Tax=Streptomyces colonosanans TaxID=1428652 RepID=A0A1S2PI27_9ACTN|nr:hypothetical protein [Streptomyces colonosanans]OIJ92664.1 hypothetical protein BIV24_13015 [Streptomyces colonosanans]